MPFAGKLKRNTTHTVVITNTSETTTAVTTLLINRRDRISDAEPNSVTGTTPTKIDIVVGDRIDRVLLMVHPSPGTQATVTVGATAPMTCDADMHFSFDTEA